MNKTKLVWCLSLSAAILYSAWIIGYFLNPVVAQNGTVSELSAISQPHRNFFVTTDILMMSGVLAVAILLISRAKKTWQKNATIFYVLFAGLTLVTTFVPLKCAPSVEACSGGVQSIGHMFAGTFAFVALFMSLLLVLFYAKPRHLSLLFFALFIWVSTAVVNTLFVLMGHTGPTIALTQRLFLLITAIFMMTVPILLVSVNASPGRAKRR